LALVIRLVPAFWLAPGANFDIESFQLTGQHVLAGEDVYSAPDTATRHPYLPAFLYWLGLAQSAAEKSGLPFASLVRLAPILTDVAIALLLTWRAARQADTSHLGDGPHQPDGPHLADAPHLRDAPYPALWSGLLYALNPLAVYVSAYHGQFDALPILFMLLALMAVERGAIGQGGWWLGLGILMKSWPVLALPAMWRALRSPADWLRLAAFSAIAPLLGLGLYVALFDAAPLTVLSRALGYNHGFGVWGLPYLVRAAGWAWPALLPLYGAYLAAGRYLTLLALGAAWLLAARKQPPLAAALTILVAFLAFTHAFSIQYLVWLLPLAIACAQWRWLKWYTLAAFSYMFLAYHTLILRVTIDTFLPLRQADQLIIMPAGLAAWLVAVVWAIRRMGTFSKP